MTVRRYLHTSNIYTYGQNGEANLDITEQISFLGFDGDAWGAGSLIVAVSFESETAALDLSLDFVDPQYPEFAAGVPVRKRVFRDTSGTVTDFVSDNLGQGWLVPPRVNGGGPMDLLFTAGRSGIDLGGAMLLVERWWEPRTLELCR